MKPVCLIIGAGAGVGGHVGKRFAREGYHAVLLRRTDEDGLARLVAEIEEEGGSASGFLLNAVEENSIEDRIASIEKDIGPIDVVVYNLGAQVGDRALEQTSYKVFELGWRMGTFGLFRTASAVCPTMAERGHGVLLVTSSTAAMRGNVAHIVIDGAVDAPDTLGRMLGPEKFQQLRETQGKADGLLRPDAIAETYWHLANQHRSVWTHELDLRPFSVMPWWNH